MSADSPPSLHASETAARIPEATDGAVLYRSAFHSLTAHIAVIDRDGRIVAVNDAWNRFAHKNGGATAFLSKNYLDACQSAMGVMDGESSIVYAGIQAVLANERDEFVLEYPCHSPTEQRWFAMCVTPLRDESGGAVIAHTDITARKRVEEALQAGEARLRLLFTNAPDHIFSTKTDGSIVTINHPGEGFDADAVIGASVFNFAYPEDVPAVKSAFERALTGAVAEYEARVPFPDGTLRWAAGRIAPIIAGGEVHELMFIVRDITERRNIEAEIQQKNAEILEANAKLTRLDRTKADFAAMLVHDLTSPLTAVTNAIELLQSGDYVRDPEMLGLLEASQRSLDRAITLVNDVLEIYRSDVSDIVLRKVRIDPLPFLSKCLNGIRATATAKNIAVKAKIVADAQFPSVFADADKLERVFSNLLANAVKFTPRGGEVTLGVQMVHADLGSALEVSVTDTGEGIPAGEVPHVFDPYHQGRTRRYQFGVGLGLAIVKRIVAAHGGSVAVTSQVGAGSRFTVLLPTGQDSADAADAGAGS